MLPFLYFLGSLFKYFSTKRTLYTEVVLHFTLQTPEVFQTISCTKSPWRSFTFWMACVISFIVVLFDFTCNENKPTEQWLTVEKTLFELDLQRFFLNFHIKELNLLVSICKRCLLRFYVDWNICELDDTIKLFWRKSLIFSGNIFVYLEFTVIYVLFIVMRH